MSITHYTLGTELARGGMGLIQLARHPRLGQVALKRLLPQTTAFARQSLRTEITLLSQLKHQGVVELVDHGEDEHGPWMAMALIPGTPLRSYLRSTTQTVSVSAPTQSLWTHSLSRETVVPDAAPPRAQMTPKSGYATEKGELLLGWLYQVAQALSYVHGQGVVHADLKPDNILITPQGRVVLVDFGLAVPFGARVEVEALQRAGLLAGSLPYISPEQCRGEPLDPRADLYALGCILFECLAGRPPFVSDDPHDLMTHHIHSIPPELTSLGAELPRSWDRVVELMEELLAKAPHQRPGHAQVMLRVLEGSGIAPVKRDADLEGRPYLHKPPLLGREGVLQQLREGWEATQKGAGDRCIWLRGESGVGKTRLAMEMIREARRQSAMVWVGYSSTALGASHHEEKPLGLFLPVLRAVADRCLQWGPEATAEWVRPVDAAVLAPYAPFMAQIRGVEVEELAALPMESARLRLFASLVGVLERVCVGQAALWVLDDVQWADELSLAALEFVINQLDTSRWLVLGVVRSEERSEMLEELMDAYPSEVMEIEQLDPRQVAQVIAQMLGHTPAPALVEALATRAGGNPFFVAAYLQAIVESDVLGLGADGRWAVLSGDGELTGRLESLPDPGPIRTLLGQRLERLRGDEQRLCEVAAALGKRIDTKVLKESSGLALFPFRNAFHELVRHRILEPLDDEAQALQFVHDRLRETAYAEADPERLAAIHRRAAEVLEAQETFEPATTALHWVCGGEPQQGRARYVEAAQRDAERWAVRDALRHLRAALDLQVGDGNADLELQAQQFQWTSLLGDHRETVQLAEQMLEQLQGTLSEAQLRLKGQAHLNAATSLEQLTQLEQSQHHIEAAAVVLEQLGEDKRLEGHIAMAQGSLLKAMGGEHEAIVALLQSAAQCYEEAGDTRLQGRSLALLSEQWLLHGRFDVSSSICREALELSRSVQDLHGEALLLRRLGQNASMTSKFAEAEAYLSQSSELHRKTGNGDGEATVHVLLGQLHAGANPEGALERFLRALELRQRYGTRHWKILSFIANICTELGRMREARMWVRRARQQAKRERSEGSAALLVMEAYVNLNLGDMKELGRIAAILRARVDQDPEAHLDAAGWLLFYEGMLHKAHSELDKALASLQAHGDAVKHQGRVEAFYFAQIEQIQVHILKGSLNDAEALLDGLPASFLEDEYAEANMLLNRATLRRHQGRLHEARADAEAAQEAFQGMNEAVMLVGAVCERAMIAYGLGEPLDPILDELLPLTQELEIFSDGDTGQCLLELQALVPEVELIRFLKHPEIDRPDEH